MVRKSFSEKIARGVESHERLIFAWNCFRGVPTIWKPDTLLATTSLVPRLWLRFRMWRHLSSLSGELSGVFVLGSKPPPLTWIASTSLETRLPLTIAEASKLKRFNFTSTCSYISRHSNIRLQTVRFVISQNREGPKRWWNLSFDRSRMRSLRRRK